MSGPVAIVEKIVNIGLKIKDAVGTVRHNEEQCNEIKRRVLRFSAILSQLQRTRMIGESDSPAMSHALEDLAETLERALKLITACRRPVVAKDLSRQLFRVHVDIMKNVSMAAFAINTATTIALTTIRAGTGSHPVHQQLIGYRPFSISSSSSGTIASTTAYTSSAASHRSSVSMSIEAAMLLDLELNNDDEDAGFVQSINESRQEWIKEKMKQMVQEFFGTPSASCIGGGDIGVLERWFMDLDVGWVLDVADAAGEPDYESDARSWIKALNEIVETISLTWPFFPDHADEQVEPENKASIPEKFQFAQFIQETMLKMLAFVDAIAASNARTIIEKILFSDPSRLVLLPYEMIIGTLLRVRGALSSAISTIQLTFHHPPSAQVERILDEIVSLLSAKEDKTGEAIWSAMEQIRMELTENVIDWSSSLTLHGSSNIHEAARYVMSYVGFVFSHYSSLEPILCQAYVPRIRRPLLISQVMEMVSCVEQELANQSGSFPDQGLRFLFLINNSNFIMQQLQDSLSSLGDHEAAAVANKVEGFMESYMQASWAPVLSCLLNSTSLLGRNYSPLSRFESEFHKIYTTQKQWKVPDPELRKRLRKAIAEKTIPGYTKYIEDNNVDAPKFTPQILEEMLQELFEG